MLVILLAGVTPNPDEPGTGAASRSGDISHMGDTPVPRNYLAIPCRTKANVICGLTVRLCGPADCVTLRQTDYGPSQRIHPDRIADVHPRMFERLCGLDASRGLCSGSWVSVRVDGDGPRATLPATDMED